VPDSLLPDKMPDCSHKKISLSYVCQDAIAGGYLMVNNTMKDIRVFSCRKNSSKACTGWMPSKNCLYGRPSQVQAGCSTRLSILENRNQYLNPLEILKRGYSHYQAKWNHCKDGTLLHQGDMLETHFHKGKRKSRVVGLIIHLPYSPLLP